MAGMVVSFDRTRDDVANAMLSRATATGTTQRAKAIITITIVLSMTIGLLLGLLLSMNLLFGLVTAVGVALVLVVALPRRLMAASAGPRSRLAQRMLASASDAVFGHISVTLRADGVQSDGPIGSQFVRWSVIKEMRDNDRGVAFVVDPQNIVLVPSRAFASPADRKAFTAEAASRMRMVR
jgi:hypothetical protein